MPKYVIEREVPGVGKLSAAELKAISQTSCGVLRQLGPEIQWVHSYVTGDKIYCIYNAPNEQLVREHARVSRQLHRRSEDNHRPDHRRILSLLQIPIQIRLEVSDPDPCFEIGSRPCVRTPVTCVTNGLALLVDSQLYPNESKYRSTYPRALLAVVLSDFWKANEYESLPRCSTGQAASQGGPGLPGSNCRCDGVVAGQRLDLLGDPTQTSRARARLYAFSFACDLWSREKIPGVPLRRG
jgi:hypothetical protein